MGPLAAPPWGEVFVPPLDIDMLVPTSSDHVPPDPVQTKLKTPLSASSGKDSLPSVGSGAHDNTVIPPSHDARTLILCFDGTGNHSVKDNSNIVQFYSMLKKDDRNQQVVYYQAGVGTYTVSSIIAPPGAKWKRTIDKAVANLIDIHIMGGYEFLMEQYHAEDKICLFGFSRGAYTARALASMVHKVGLLPAGHRQQISSAYEMYARDDEISWQESMGFKKTFSIDVEIEFVGVWDTVCSSGMIPYTLPLMLSNTSLRYFRHAIALDERRARFKANYWHRLQDNKQKGTKLGEMPRSNQHHPQYHSSHDRDTEMSSEEKDRPRATDVREVWFAGCHSDVGGGSVEGGTRNSLSRISLRWMIRECFRANTGIQFHRESLKRIGLDPDTFLEPRPPAIAPTPTPVAQVETAAHAPGPTDATVVDHVQGFPAAASTFKSEEDEELADALSEKHDQLEISKPWWILEILPMRELNRDNFSLTKKWILNLGGGRKFPATIREKREKFLVHRSVKTRMDAKGLPEGKYEPKAKFEHLDYEYVD